MNKELLEIIDKIISEHNTPADGKIPTKKQTAEQLEDITGGNYSQSQKIRAGMAKQRIIYNELTPYEGWQELTIILDTPHKELPSAIKTAPKFKVGDEQKIIIYDDDLKNYFTRCAAFANRTFNDEDITDSILKRAKEGILAEKLKDLWISEAKERGLWKPDAFRAVKPAKDDASPADNWVLKIVASNYVQGEDRKAKQIWYDFKESWLNREISEKDYANEFKKRNFEIEKQRGKSK